MPQAEERPEAGGKLGTDPPRRLQRDLALRAPRSWASSLQTEGHASAVVGHLLCGCSSQQPQETNTCLLCVCGGGPERSLSPHGVREDRLSTPHAPSRSTPARALPAQIPTTHVFTGPRVAREGLKTTIHQKKADVPQSRTELCWEEPFLGHAPRASRRCHAPGTAVVTGRAATAAVPSGSFRCLSSAHKRWAGKFKPEALVCLPHSEESPSPESARWP